MGDLEHQHHQLSILNVTDHPVVAYAVAPESCEVGKCGDLEPVALMVILSALSG
jgi:hypothetical protein